MATLADCLRSVNDGNNSCCQYKGFTISRRDATSLQEDCEKNKVWLMNSIKIFENSGKNVKIHWGFKKIVGTCLMKYWENTRKIVEKYWDII